MFKEKVKGITTKTYKSIKPPPARYHDPDAAHISKKDLVRKQQEWAEEEAELKEVRKEIKKRKAK